MDRRMPISLGVFVLTVCLATSFLPAESSQPVARPPAESLRGTWRAEIADSQALLLEFQGEAVVMTVEAQGKFNPVWSGKFTVPAEDPDNHMDWIELKAGGRSIPDNKCLYRLIGDTLLVIGGGPGSRPTHFYSGPGSEPKTLVFARVQPVRKR